MSLTKIVSGGQTGVDRAALDAAMALGLPRGGWCPRGRRAEDGVIADDYPLTETASDGYAERTRLNVRDSDATLIIARGRLMGGTKLTLRHARDLGRPFFVAYLNRRPKPLDIARWIAGHAVAVLNVAGPRESSQPGIHDAARTLLVNVLLETRRTLLP